jgi:hypothetical protein
MTWVRHADDVAVPKKNLRAIGYQHMLVIIVVAYVLIIAIPVPSVGGPIRVAVLGWLLTIAVETRGRSTRWLRPAIGLGIVLVAVTVVTASKGTDKDLIAISSAATSVLVGLAIYMIARSLLANKVIDGPAVRAVLCIYLLLALFFASLNQFFGVFFNPWLSGASNPPTASQTLYFSVVTLATVGYGDIVPVNALARALVVAQALIGQLYLVSVVAAVVAQYRRTQPGDENGSESPNPPDGE